MLISKNTKHSPDRGLTRTLYIMAAILLVAWGLGFLVFGIAGIIHLLLALSVVAVISGIMQENRFL